MRRLTIRAGDRSYGLCADTPSALSYFERSYAACHGDAGEESVCFRLERRETDWRGSCNGRELALGPLERVTALVDWELTRRAVKEDTACAAFHAAWVARDGRAVMIAGDGGSGKSRSCWWLLERGWRCGSDDVTFIRDDRLIPFPRAIRLREDDPTLRRVPARRQFGDCDGRRGISLGRDDAAPPIGLGNLVIVFPEPVTSGGPRPLAALEGLERLFGLCHRLDRVTRSAFARLVEIACDGRMYALPGRSAEAALLDLLEVGDG